MRKSFEYWTRSTEPWDGDLIDSSATATPGERPATVLYPLKTYDWRDDAPHYGHFVHIQTWDGDKAVSITKDLDGNTVDRTEARP